MSVNNTGDENPHKEKKIKNKKATKKHRTIKKRSKTRRETKFDSISVKDEKECIINNNKNLSSATNTDIGLLSQMSVNNTCDENPHKEKKIKNIKATKKYRASKKNSKTCGEKKLNDYIQKFDSISVKDEKELSYGVQRIVNEVIDDTCLSEETIKDLNNLKIEVNWNLPVSHALDTGSHNLSKMKSEIVMALKMKGLVWKNKVNYTDEECEQIKKNWEEFSKLYGFEDPKVFFQSKAYVTACKYSERLNFKRFLAKGLPDRPLFSVYIKFNQLYGCKNKGRWTEEEDLILQAILRCKFRKEIMKKRIVICKALQRNWMSVHRRMKLLEERVQRAKPVDWTVDLMECLLKNLLKNTRCSNIEILKDLDIQENIWEKLSQEMAIPVEEVSRFWYEQMHVQLFTKKPISQLKLYIKIIEWLYDSKYTSWKDISWEKLTRRYGVHERFLKRVTENLVADIVPKKERKNFRGSLDYLYENYLPKLKSGSEPDNLLCRFKYCADQGVLVEINDTEEYFAVKNENDS